MSKALELIVEMGKSRNIAMDKIESFSNTLVLHLVKLVSFPKHQAGMQWLNSINHSFLNLFRHNIPEGTNKKSRKNYDKKDLDKYLWDSPLSTQKDIESYKMELFNDGLALDPSDIEIDHEKLRRLVFIFIDTIDKRETLNIRGILKKEGINIKGKSR